MFRQSRFHMCVLLISTFVLFMVVPNMVYLFYGVVGGHKSDTLDDALLILFNCSYLLDAWIYIFAQRSVRHLCCRKMHKKKEWLRYTQQSLRRSMIHADHFPLRLKELTAPPNRTKEILHERCGNDSIALSKIKCSGL